MKQSEFNEDLHAHPKDRRTLNTTYEGGPSLPGALVRRRARSASPTPSTHKPDGRSDRTTPDGRSDRTTPSTSSSCKHRTCRTTILKFLIYVLRKGTAGLGRQFRFQESSLTMNLFTYPIFFVLPSTTPCVYNKLSFQLIPQIMHEWVLKQSEIDVEACHINMGLFQMDDFLF